MLANAAGDGISSPLSRSGADEATGTACTDGELRSAIMQAILQHDGQAVLLNGALRPSEASGATAVSTAGSFASAPCIEPIALACRGAITRVTATRMLSQRLSTKRSRQVMGPSVDMTRNDGPPQLVPWRAAPILTEHQQLIRINSGSDEGLHPRLSVCGEPHDRTRCKVGGDG